MRNLQQIFRRAGLLSSEKRRQRSEKKRRGEVSRRRLTSEVLEQRQLLAGDILASDINPNHNYHNGFDVNADGAITANDALRIINRLSIGGEGESAAAPNAQGIYLDVNNDSIISASDALSVINAMGRGEEVGEFLELVLTPRDLNDDEIATDANGEITVNINEPFDLEISYDDFRNRPFHVGAFQLYTDLGVSEGGFLVPVLNETQQIFIDPEINDAPSADSPVSVTFTIDSLPPNANAGAVTEFVSTYDDFANSSKREMRLALEAFGYSRSQFDISTPVNNRLLLQIHWVGDEFGNVDLPNINVEVNEAAGQPNIATETREFAPLVGGQPNSEAVRFNIDSRSRTATDNDEVYNGFNRGTFTSADGFTDIGGQALTTDGDIGVFNEDDGFPGGVVFDAYSIRVMVTKVTTTPLIVDVNPGEATEALLLYLGPIDPNDPDAPDPNPIAKDLQLVEAVDSGNNGIAVVKINAVDPNNNTNPVANNDGPVSTPQDTAVTIQVLANDTDANNDTLSVSAVGNPTNGTAVINGTNVVYTPTANFVGSDSFEYTVSDGNGGTDTATVTVTVTAVVSNTNPVANNDGPVSTPQDTAVTIQVLSNDTDVDNDTLSVSAVGNPSNGTAVINGTNVVYTPAANFVGSDSFQYTVSDGNGGTDTATVSVTVTAVSSNTDPVANNDGPVSTPQDTAVTIQVLGNDTDANNDTLSITSVGNPSNGTAVINGTNVVYTPAANFVGSDSFLYTISDGNGGSDSATVTITVTAVASNTNPVANNDGPVSTPQDTALTVQVLANDTDADNDTLSIASVGNPSNGTAVINGTNVVYTPAANFVGSDSFQYTVSDGNGGTDTATVSVTVTAVVANTAPVANNDGPVSTPQDTALTIQVLANDTDADNDTLSITSVGNPSNGTAVINGTNVVYTPAANFVGSDSFQYAISDGNGGSDSATVTVTVTAVVPNTAPVANNDGPVSTLHDTAITIQVLANDTDADNDTLSIASVGNPSNGTAVINGTNVVYTPAANFVGSDSFQYTVSDGNGGTDTATVSVTVTNTAPVANNDGPVSTLQDTAVTIQVLANDTDADSDTLSVSSVGNPSNGTAVINGTNVVYTPAANFFGSDSFQYTVSDGSGGTDTATVSVSVTEVVTVVAGNGTLPVNEDGTANIDLASLISGVSNPNIVISTNGSLGNATLNGSTLTYTPSANAFGTDTIVYTASGGGDSDSGTITVNIASVNDLPTAVNDSAIAFTGSTVRISVLGNDNAGPTNENQALTIVAASSNQGTATPNTDGTISFTPAANFTGNATISYTIRDSGGLEDSAVVSVTVQNFNPSSISGSLFIDHIENLDEVIAGGDPVRNGIKESDEQGFTGVPIRLVSPASDNSSGQPINLIVLTDIDGAYTFENIAPGTYQVVYEIPEGIIFVDANGQQVTGTQSHSVAISSSGGATVVGTNFAAIGTMGTLNNLNILASSYLRSNDTMSQMSGSGLEGGTVSLDASGNQNFLLVGAGFENVVFAELVLNQDRDAALLTIIEEDGDILTARLSEDHFVVSPDGAGVRFFGGVDDFQFADADSDLVRQEFANYRNAIDQVLGNL